MGHVESCFDPFGDGVSVGARLVHGLWQTYHGSEIILDAPDGTPRDVGLVECHSSPFRDVVSVATRYVHGLRQTYHRPRNHFGRTRWYC